MPPPNHNHIYQLPQRTRLTPTTAILGKRRRGGWKKYIPFVVVLLLANEIIVGVIINWRETPALVPNQPAFFDTIKAEVTTKELSQLEIEMQQPQQHLNSNKKFLSSIAEIGNKQAFVPNEKHVQALNADTAELGELSNETKAFALNLNTTDVDLLRHACISYSDETKVHHISYRGVYGTWKGRTKDPYDRESFHLASRKNPWLKTSYVGYQEKLPANLDSPVMFIPAIFNPSNCLHDLIFSLLPMAFYGKLHDLKAIAVKRPAYHDDNPVRDYSGDYCTLVVKELGWFQNFTLVPDSTCLEDVWVPTFMYHRFPRGWANNNGRISNEYIYNKDLPLTMIHFFQQQMWKSFLAGNKYMHKKNKKRIIFDSREGTGKGEWTNANEIAARLREELDPEQFVIEVVDDVGALTIEEQAALFHSAALLVAPQDSTIANAIFMRPTGVIFELSCGEEPSWIRDWLTDLRIRHSMVRADPLACTTPDHRTYEVRPKDMIDLIVDVFWKGQKKKRNSIQRRSQNLNKMQQ